MVCPNFCACACVRGQGVLARMYQDLEERDQKGHGGGEAGDRSPMKQNKVPGRKRDADALYLEYASCLRALDTTMKQRVSQLASTGNLRAAAESTRDV